MCRSAQRRHLYEQDTEAARHYSWRAQGINVDEAKAALAEHKGRCELCARDTPRGMGDWHIDHAHGPSRVRGVLCFPCNILLGKVERIGAEKIVQYLRRDKRERGSKQ